MWSTRLGKQPGEICHLAVRKATKVRIARHVVTRSMSAKECKTLREERDTLPPSLLAALHVRFWWSSVNSFCTDSTRHVLWHALWNLWRRLRLHAPTTLDCMASGVYVLDAAAHNNKNSLVENTLHPASFNHAHNTAGTL